MQANRRRLIQGIAGLSLGPVLPAFTRHAMAANADITPVNDSITLISGMGGNVVAYAGTEGRVLVDSGNAAFTEQLVDTLNRLGGNSPVNTVFNTHYHADQTGGNAAFAGSGASIIAHERTKQWLGTPYWIPAELRYATPASEDSLPTETFLEHGELTLADEQIEYGYLVEAHTSSDIYVKFTQANVLVVGDVVSPQVDPALDWYTGAWIGGRRDALDQLLALSDNDTAIVPAYGPVLTREHLEAERDLMAFIYDKTTELVRQGFGPDDMLQDGFMGNLPRQFSDPHAFLYDLCKGLWAHHNKINHNIV